MHRGEPLVQLLVLCLGPPVTPERSPWVPVKPAFLEFTASGEQEVWWNESAQRRPYQLAI